MRLPGGSPDRPVQAESPQVHMARVVCAMVQQHGECVGMSFFRCGQQRV